MTIREASSYEQTLLDRVTSLTRETSNLREAYLIVNQRCNKLLSIAARTSKELFEEATKIEECTTLALEAAILTEQSALKLKNSELIAAARKSAITATAVYNLAIELKTVKLAMLSSNNIYLD